MGGSWRGWSLEWAWPTVLTAFSLLAGGLWAGPIPLALLAVATVCSADAVARGQTWGVLHDLVLASALATAVFVGWLPLWAVVPAAGAALSFSRAAGLLWRFDRMAAVAAAAACIGLGAGTVTALKMASLPGERADGKGGCPHPTVEPADDGALEYPPHHAIDPMPDGPLMPPDLDEEPSSETPG
jgi:hypothetical protein